MKKYRIIALIVSIITVCIVALLLFMCNLQAVFACIGTDLENGVTYSMHNLQTDNVYVFQTSPKIETVTLYRKTENGALLRYRLQDNIAETSFGDTNGWKPSNTSVLPAAPRDLIKEILSIITKKSNDTTVIKKYADTFFSSFIGAEIDSSIFVNYNDFPKAILNIWEILKKNTDVGFQKIQKTDNGLEKIWIIENVVSADMLQLVFAELMQILHTDATDVSIEDLPIEIEIDESLSMQISLSLFGSLRSISVFSNNDCIYRIKKLK